MANADKPTGLRPIGHILGLPWSGSLMTAYIPSTDSTATFMYDLVQVAGSADTLGHAPTVAQHAAAQTDNLGVIVGFGNTFQLGADVTSLARLYRPAATAMYVSLVVDPYVIFEAQEDSVSATLDADSAGRHCDVTVGSGSTTTGLSAMEIDSDSLGTTGALKLLSIVNRADNALGTNCNWNVIVAEHALSSALATGT
jgi:hypothetical protein